jgi:tubulin beta
MQVGQCGNQVGKKCWEVVCDEHSIGGSREYCGDNDEHLGRINELYSEASGGRTMLFDLEPSVIFAVTLSLR